MNTATMRPLPEILSALKWSKAKLRNTSKGPRMVRSATANKEIIDLWESSRSAIYAAGYSVGEWNGEMQITEWRKPTENQEAAVEPADRLSKTNLRSLSKKYAPKGPEEPWLSGRTEEDMKVRMAEIRQYGYAEYCRRHMPST